MTGLGDIYNRLQQRQAYMGSTISPQQIARLNNRFTWMKGLGAPMQNYQGLMAGINQPNLGTTHFINPPGLNINWKRFQSVPVRPGRFGQYRPNRFKGLFE